MPLLLPAFHAGLGGDRWDGEIESALRGHCGSQRNKTIPLLLLLLPLLLIPLLLPPAPPPDGCCLWSRPSQPSCRRNAVVSPVWNPSLSEHRDASQTLLLPAAGSPRPSRGAPAGPPLPSTGIQLENHSRGWEGEQHPHSPTGAPDQPHAGGMLLFCHAKVWVGISRVWRCHGGCPVPA